ncbi:hypothetical protein [Frankia sp. EAN1pec]|uniref:hypothetical protein n=1 Tax=Parafrankia sp. (strain EAN1pec) TaxID=298653 RepID=UPI0000544A3F
MRPVAGEGASAALWARIEAYEEGDDEALTSAAAVTEAALLRDSLDPDDTVALAALTKHHWYRFHAGLGPEELAAGISAADRLRELDPDALPPALRDVLDIVDAALTGEDLTLDFGDDVEWRDGYIHLLFTLAQVWWFAYIDADATGDATAGPVHDRAVAAMSLTRAVMPGDDRLRPLATGLLGRYLSTRGARTGNPDDLAHAAALLREALDATAVGDEFRGSLHSFLLETLATVVTQDDTPAGGIAFAQAATEALRELGPGESDFPHLSELADNFAAHRLAADLAQDRDIDERVAYAQLGTLTRPDATPERAGALYQLATALHARAGARLSLADNTEAIAALREMAGLLADAAQPAQRALPHTLLSVLLDQRLGFTGDPAVVPEGVAAARRAVELLPADSDLRAYCLTNLGCVLAMSYDVNGALADLDESLDVLRRAIDEGAETNARTLSVLGTGHVYRYDKAGNPVDLEAGVRWTRAAVDVMAPDDPGRADWLGNLATALLTWHRHAGAPELLDETVELFREAAALTPPEHADRERAQSNVGDALTERYQSTGSPDDIQEAVTAAREAVTHAVPGTPGTAKSRTVLGNALLYRYELTGDPADLDEAIDLSELAGRAGGAAPVTARDHNNLGVALLVRYDLTGSGTDLDRAIAAYGQARALAIPGSGEAVRALLNLGNAFEYRYRVIGRRDDLDQAVALLRAAAAAGPGAAERPSGRWCLSTSARPSPPAIRSPPAPRTSTRR